MFSHCRFILLRKVTVSLFYIIYIFQICLKSLPNFLAAYPHVHTSLASSLGSSIKGLTSLTQSFKLLKFLSNVRKSQPASRTPHSQIPLKSQFLSTRSQFLSKSLQIPALITNQLSQILTKLRIHLRWFASIPIQGHCESLKLLKIRGRFLKAVLVFLQRGQIFSSQTPA